MTRQEYLNPRPDAPGLVALAHLDKPRKRRVAKKRKEEKETKEEENRETEGSQSITQGSDDEMILTMQLLKRIDELNREMAEVRRLMAIHWTERYKEQKHPDGTWAQNWTEF